MTDLFTPYELKGMTLKNRIVMPPMCQYSVHAEDGIPNSWHKVHYISRAVGGVGLIIVEMTGVEAEGRITFQDTGLWNDEQISAHQEIVQDVHHYGTKIGIQLGHAGRKAQDALPPVAPSAIPFDDRSKTPRALTTLEVKEQVQYFQDATRRAVEAGYDTIEIHGAHGYLIHQFHSPLTNQREDEYGVDLALFGEEVVRAVKEVTPGDMPIIMRVSAMEYVEGGYDLAYCAKICERYRDAGVDLFHVSSGGEGPIGSNGGPNAGQGYQVELAEDLRSLLYVPVIAVGRLDSFEDANQVIEDHRAELVAVGRGMLKDPYWALHAAQALNISGQIPKPYLRGF